MANEQHDLNHNMRLRISFCAYRHEIIIGKHVVRIFNSPAYMCFRVSKNRDSIIVFPCSREDVLAFMVPPNLFTKPGRLYRIISKAFVDELCSYNNLDINTNYSVPGKYDEKSNVAVFNLIDAHEATLGKGEENA